MLAYCINFLIACDSSALFLHEKKADQTAYQYSRDYNDFWP